MSTRDLPVFPDIQPESITRTHFYPIIDVDLKREDSVAAIAMQMFMDTAGSFYYFHRKDQAPLIPSSGDIGWETSDFFFYQHLNERDFVRIVAGPDGGYQWDWEKEYVDTRPEFIRHTLKLSDRKRWQLETVERIHLEEFYREQRRRQTYASDVFLSSAAANRREAELIENKITAAGKKVFMSVKDLEPGEDFAEEIRNALRETRELWLLVTPQSLKSEWVMTEWGAAWVLGKPIIPILHRCRPEELVDRLKRLQYIDLYEIDTYIARHFNHSASTDTLRQRPEH